LNVESEEIVIHNYKCKWKGERRRWKLQR
jgi:hypothetical protein